MNLRFPTINAQRFSANFIKAQARRQLEDKLWPLLDGVGEERIRWLIENDQTLYTRLPSTLYEGAKGYSWALNAFSRDDFIGMLPDWLVKLCQSNEQSTTWLDREVDGIRKLLGGEQ